MGISRDRATRWFNFTELGGPGGGMDFMCRGFDYILDGGNFFIFLIKI